MIHCLKCEPEYFTDIEIGAKTFEVRKNDRGFRVGDYIGLNEYDPVMQRYTGRDLLVEITYMLDDERFCKEGYCVMGIQIQKTSR